jgi:hypothetical protein
VVGLSTRLFSASHDVRNAPTVSTSSTTTPPGSRSGSFVSSAAAAPLLVKPARRCVVRFPAVDGMSTANAHVPCRLDAASFGHAVPSCRPSCPRQAHRL